MNWTGGQLHRSARQGTLSKIQKQNFAKSRQLAIDRVPRQPSPFRGFSNLRKHEEQSACKDERGEQAVAAAGHIQSDLEQFHIIATRHCFQSSCANESVMSLGTPDQTSLKYPGVCPPVTAISTR